MIMNLGVQHRVLEYYQVCSNDDPGLILTYFTARSNLVPYAFVWEKGKTVDFSETIVVYDLELATDDQSDKKFLLTSKLCPLGGGEGELYAPAPRLNTCIKSWKIMYKIRLQRDFFETCNKWVVIRPSCWHQNFVPWGLSIPAPGLYTCIKSWIQKMHKIRLQRDFFETCNKWVKW